MTRKAAKAAVKRPVEVTTVRKSRAVASAGDGGTGMVPTALLTDLRTMIEAAGRAAAVTVNSAQTQLYWRVGKRIREDVLGTERAQYGQAIVATLSRQLASLRAERYA
jgi:hypothetical protein